MSTFSSKLSPALVIALISIPIFIGALDLTVVSAVLPHVIYDLEIPLPAGLDDAAWVVSGYLLAYTVAMTFMGRLSDLVGRPKVYLLSLVIFALGSYLVAVADEWPTQLALRGFYLLLEQRPDPARISLWMLIGARMIQAFGGGAMVPVGMALAGDLYPPAQRAKALGVIAAVDTSGWVVGHLYGGILTRYFNWRLIFWLNLPVCVLTFVLIAVALRGLPRPQKAGRMDWLGALLVSLGLMALNLGLGSSAEAMNGFSGPEGQAARFSSPYLIAAGVLLLLFIWRQARAVAPLIPLHLFRRPNFSAATLANFLIGFSLFIAIADVPLFINTLVAQTLEQGAWDSGWMLSALTVPMALASIPGGWLTDRAGYRLPALVGLGGAIVGFLLMNGWQAATPYLAMIPHLILAGVGFGLTIAPIAAAVINAAPDAYRGTASALVIIFRLVGMMVSASGIATFGAQRSQAISTQLLAGSSDLQATVQAGMNAAEQVIQETFLIAAGVCLLAVVSVSFLKTLVIERSSQ
jgi:MFS family permease